MPLGFSPPRAKVEGDLVFVGYGITVPKGRDDYAKKNVRNKIVVVRRFVPETPEFASTDAKRRYGDLRFKAWVAEAEGRAALVVVDEPGSRRPAAPQGLESRRTRRSFRGARARGLRRRRHSRRRVKRAARRAARREARPGRAPARRGVRSSSFRSRSSAFNVVGRIGAAPEAGAEAPGHDRDRRALRPPRLRRASFARARRHEAARRRRRQRFGHRRACSKSRACCSLPKREARSGATSCSSRSPARSRACSARRTSFTRAKRKRPARSLRKTWSRC